MCMTDRQTDKERDRIGPIQSSSGTVFGSAKSQIPLADASKRCSENNIPNSLRIPVNSLEPTPIVNGHLRLPSVVALSSNGACGTTIVKGPLLDEDGAYVCLVAA